MTRTYQQVFGVPLGSELREGQGINWVPCKAVTALRAVLGAHSFFGGSKLGGVGPLFRVDNSGNLTHEFNRHHGGLSVDIMLDPKNSAETTLGQNLVRLFEEHHDTMKWWGLIYQGYWNNPHSSLKLAPGCNTKGGHDDHIHIDWFNPNGGAVMQPIASVPLRRGGTVVDMKPVNGSSIATTINWTAEASTDFSTDRDLIDAIDDLMKKHAAGTLQPIDLSSNSCGAKPVPPPALVGNWNVTIGGWSGVFIFRPDGGMAWADSATSRQNPGKWKATDRDLQWTFDDPTDIRTFVVSLPLTPSLTKGHILPRGQGFFEMSR